MIKTLRNSFFNDKIYSLLYCHHFFSNMVRAIMYTFTGAYFLSLGMPLHFVLLFYGLEFGIRGFLCPYGLSFMSKVGLLPALFIATILKVLFFAGIALAGDNLILAFSSLLIHAISGAIYYPFLDIMEAIYVKDNKNRTKQLSMSLVAGSFGMVIGTTAVGYFLEHLGFNAVLIFSTIILTLSIVPFILLKDNNPQTPKTRAGDVFKFFVQEDFRPLWQPFFGEQLIIIFKIVMVPLFIASIVSGFDTLGYLIALAMITENVFTLVAGHYTDRFGTKRTIRMSLLTYGSAMAAYAFLAKTPISVFFVESYHKITGNIFGAAFRSGIHAHLREKFPDNILLTGAGFQMALCFGELIVLPIYALIAYFFGMNVFFFACGMSIVGVWLINCYFQKRV